MRICPECKGRTPERVCPTCRITTVDEAALSGHDLLGKVFVDRYEIVELLGRGGMGAVYRARHIAMDSQVALKVLRREASTDLDSIERFYREARAASRLAHPNTIRVFDFGQSEDGQLFLAMEYLEGRTLRAEVRRVGRMDPSRVLRIAEQIARSLGEAHEKGIVHRDVKPENIFLMTMIGHPDFVKVLDFGVARTLAGESLTRTGLAIGTPAYMSPEQARGERVDGRSDLYSLGVMMFEMAAGIPPFESSTPMHLMLKHISEPPPRLSDVCGGGIPPDFEALVHQLLAKVADDRPHDASALLDRIAVLRSTVPTPRETQATLTLGAEHPTPPRSDSTPFLGRPEPTPTTPMNAAVAEGLNGPSRQGATFLGAPPLHGEGPRSQGTAAQETRTVLTPVPTPSLDLGPAPGGRRSRWVPVVVAGAIGVVVIALGAGWLMSQATSTSEVPVPAAVPTSAEAAKGTAPVAPAQAAPAPATMPATPPATPAATPSPPAPPAVAPAAPAPAPAKARLSGTPDGAKVARLPDGALLGRLPLDIDVPPGTTLRVRITAPGYKSTDLALAYDEVLATPARSVKLSKKASGGGDGWDL
jgi:serine/threonine-protein kinase